MQQPSISMGSAVSDAACASGSWAYVVRYQTFSFVVAGLAFVAALTWSQLFQIILQRIFPPSSTQDDSSIRRRLVQALMVTIIVIVVIHILRRLLVGNGPQGLIIVKRMMP